jgi:single-stranded-DNA-specific exonuclease
MVEEFYRPTIVVSIGEKYSKASARSISGFNIIEFIREQSSFLVDAGGHPMAAGFTVETTKLSLLQKAFEDKAKLMLNNELLSRSLKIDCEIPLSFIDINFYKKLQELSPFGMGNPEPTFVSKGILVEDIRVIGVDGKHLKIKVNNMDAIAFGMGEKSFRIKIGDKINVVYTIDENEWNGEKRLQLKIKDLRAV